VAIFVDPGDTMSAILAASRLGELHWPTLDPFLFCAHHLDHYPRGNEAMGPDASLSGREMGSDFAGKDGWRMYHGSTIPGFPQHPHRGFETVTLARQGFIDHSDSLGATARFGHGDAQWMTAGRGIVHSEMFPLVRRDEGNPTELFQLWLNLPRSDKMVAPHFTMFWSEKIPRHDFDGVEVVTVAGAIGGVAPPAPPPASWASRPEAEVAIWTIRMPPGTRWTLPTASKAAGRVLYVFEGAVRVDGQRVGAPTAVQLRPEAVVTLESEAKSEMLMLQGRPIAEPVAKHGPFVMNTQAEIQQAFVDYRQTRFGGWPWRSDGPAHPRDEGRFAIHADGRKERPA
jgi:hypothetical protein